MNQQGPNLIVVASEQAIAAGSSLVVDYRWPADLFLEALSLVPDSGSAADLAGLTLQALDKDGDPLFQSGTGPQAISGLAIMGGLALLLASSLPAMRPYAIQRPVLAGSRWRFTIANGNAGAVTPELLVHFRRLRR
jgi:hypothetical protein